MPPNIRDIPPGFPRQVLEAFAEGFLCGQSGTITVTITDGSNTVIVGPTTAGIIEIDCTGAPDNSGVYRYLGTYPTDPSLSPYVIIWTGQNLAGSVVTGSEEFQVTTDAPAVPSDAGPCTDWIDGADVADCCSVDYDSDTASALDDAAGVAQNLLYQLSGRQFAGLCGPITVRPCRQGNACWPFFQEISYAGGGSWPLWGAYGGLWGWWYGGATSCGCRPESQVKLSGYPVQGIAQVKIDGDIVPPSDYRLDKKRFLTRMNDGLWPICQDLTLTDDQPGTFSISYWYGQSPPVAGIAAAKQLACEIYKACAGEDCELPTGTTRLIRQGVTIEKLAFSAFSIQQDRGSKKPVWRTGLALVDSFLSAYNPTGLAKTPIFYGPGNRHRYAPIIP